MAEWNAYYQNDDDDEEEQEEGEQFRGKLVNLFNSTFIFGIISVIHLYWITFSHQSSCV